MVSEVVLSWEQLKIFKIQGLFDSVQLVDEIFDWLIGSHMKS